MSTIVVEIEIKSDYLEMINTLEFDEIEIKMLENGN